jgi:tetratricopeptide (TPR) repeat protein
MAYETEKHDLSPLETSNLLGDYGPSPGTNQFYFESTPVGKLGVMICADEFDRETRNEFLKHNFDILCVIAFQPKGKDHHQSINEIVKEANEGIYVAYANALCNSLTDGQSAFFGNEYKEGRVEYVETGLTKDDGLEMKLVEMPSQAGCLIVECNILTKKPIIRNLDPNRALVNAELPYIFENGNLRQFTKEELKKLHEKSTKIKIEYQPSIPPIKTFVADYIGRRSDIDYLSEFLNNPKKHFLLLYGVGGMGKSHLLYCCMKDYKQKTFSYHVVSPNEEFTLNKLFEVCLLPKPDAKLSLEEKQDLFFVKFQENNTHLILDDYYEVQLDEVKSILPKLTGIGMGKLLLLSRIIPSNISHIKGNYLNHKILPLTEPDFKQVIQNYILDKNITLTEEEIHLIDEKAQGYPLGGQLIIDAKPYSRNLQELLTNLGKFEAEIDPEGKAYSGRILDNIFKKGDSKEIKLLCEFSALFGVSDIETVRHLPSYNLKLFQGLHSRKSFVEMDAQGKFSSHAMIRDFAYHRLQNKEVLHLKLAEYFENKINGRTDDDWKWLNETILHYTKSPKAELYSFINRVEINFESRNIKGQIDKNNILNTIRNYTTLLNLYPDKPAYYNELGIAYRMNRQQRNAIETFERALAIKPNDVKALNELGITYRENNQKTKAIETFERALAIDEKHLPSLNELGITYRKNNQKTKAIETFERALAIEPKALPSLNELGITYRENNQKTKAIETFERALEIEPKALPSLNELGITYRENNQIEEAINICARTLRISKHKPSNLNLLQIYLFFKPDKQKAKINFDISKEQPQLSHFNNNKNHYLRFIDNIIPICNLSIEDFKIYDKYIDWSLRDNIRAYHHTLELLFKLNEKFSGNSKIISRLARTLCSQVISENEKGRNYSKQAIILFKKENNNKQLQSMLIFYLYNLLNQHQMELIETEMKTYEKDLIQDADYFRFMAHYSFTKNSHIDEAIGFFEKAIDHAEDLIEKREFAESLLRFLSEQNNKLYKTYYLKYDNLL